MYNNHCRPAPRWTCSQYYWYSRLLYTRDSACLTAIVGPLHAGHVLNATGIVFCSVLETQHILSKNENFTWYYADLYMFAFIIETVDVH